MSVTDYLPYLPIRKWLPKYNVGTLRDDLIAGITVGLMVVPQSLAYASNIAGLRPEAGLYSSWAGIMIYMFLGTSKDVTLGPTAIMSKITAENAETGHFCASNSTGLPTDADDCERVTRNAVVLCLLGGTLNLIMGLLRLGFVIDFISYPVLTGFTTSAALTIAWGQVHSLLGLSSKIVRRQFQDSVHDVFANLHLVKYPDIIMGFVCILLTIACQKLKQKMDKKKKRNLIENVGWFVGAAGNFFVVLFGIFVVMGFSQNSSHVVCTKHLTKNCLTDEGTIPAGLKLSAPPSVTSKDVSNLAVGAVLVALIGYLESVAIASAFARNNGYQIDTTQELVAIGCSNIVSFFVGSFPVTGSFSRTAVNSATGVATPAAGLVTGSIVLISIQWLTPVMKYISKASLAAIIIVSVVKMFNYNMPIQLWKVSKIDLVPWALSFFGCTFLGIEYGVTAGAIANMLLLVYFQARPTHVVMWRDQKGTPRALNAIAEGSTGAVQNGNHDLVSKPSDTNASKTVVCKIGGSILYPVGGEWKKVLENALASCKCTAVVLDFTHVARIDYGGLTALKEAVEDCQRAGAVVHFAEMGYLVNEVLCRAEFWRKMNMSEASATQSVPEAIVAAEGDAMEAAPDSNDPSQPLLSRPPRSPSGGGNTFASSTDSGLIQ